MQEWNNIKSDVRKIPFQTYLNKIIREETKLHRRKFNNIDNIPYIENLLHHKLTNGRKRIFALILCPYIINIKGFSLEKSEEIIFKYFDRYFTRSIIRYELKRVAKKGVLPYSLHKMKSNDSELYEIIFNQSIMVQT